MLQQEDSAIGPAYARHLPKCPDRIRKRAGTERREDGIEGVVREWQVLGI
jgi:hypothetical protein